VAAAGKTVLVYFSASLCGGLTLLILCVCVINLSTPEHRIRFSMLFFGSAPLGSLLGPAIVWLIRYRRRQQDAASPASGEDRPTDP
jgi:hypothetical protein